jgi:hypothetical protein
MKSPVEFHPTLIVGLGGTGHSALIRLKKRFIDKFGKVPSIVQFLSIDTTQQPEPSITAADGQTQVELEPNNEAYIVQVEDPSSLLGSNNPHIDRWWPSGSSVAAIISGAQQVRARGRLALFANYAEIKGRLAQKLDETRKVENISRMMDDGFNISDRRGVEVYIVSSLAGGTGSGMFLDIAFILRNIAPSSNISGIFVLPRVFARLPGTDLIKTNTYAALKELEHFSKLKDTDLQLEPIDYGIDKIQIKRPPFDLVYIIDSINEGERVIDNLKILNSRIADGLYLLIGSAIGTGNSNAIDNIKSHLVTAGLIGTYSASYCSFGVASCRWQAEEFKKMYEKRHLESAKYLISDLFQKLAPDSFPDSDAVKFIQDNHLGVSQISHLLSDMGGSIRPLTIDDLTFNKAAGDSLIKKADNYLEKEEKNFKAAIDAKFAQVSDHIDESFDKLREEHLKKQDFLTYSDDFSAVLSKHLQDLEDALKHQLGMPEFDLTRINFTDQKEKIYEAKKGWFGLGFFVSRSMKVACGNYAAQANNRVKAILKREQALKAINLVESLRAKAVEISQHCISIRSKMKEVLDNLTAKHEDEKFEPDKQNPFEHVLSYMPQMPELKPRPSEFIKWCREQHGSVYSFVNKSLEEIEKNIMDFVSADNVKLNDLSIDYVFQEAYSPTVSAHQNGQPNKNFLDVKDALDRLSRLAAPLWRYNNSEIPLSRNPASKISYCGVRDADLQPHPLDPYKGSWLSSGKTEYITTIDQNRITFFNVTFGVPLFALQGIKEMHFEYYAKRTNNSCHLNHRGSGELPDLIPLQAGFALSYFAVAQVLGLIKKNRDHAYTVYLKTNNGMSNEFLLARGRKEAYTTFESTYNIVQAVKDVITEKMNSADKNSIVSRLEQYNNAQKKILSTDGADRAYAEQPIINGSKIPDASDQDYWPNDIDGEDYEFIREEVQAIDDFLKRMSSH